jgi:uncharacterized protein YegL
MTKKKTAAGRTHIMFVLDKSNSMNRLRNGVIEGFNTMIAEQRKEKSPCSVSVVQFDDQYEETFLDVPLEDVPLLTALMYEPRGNTALFDAIGRAITSLGTRIDRLAVADRPEKVIVIVHTDGEENCSKERKPEEIRALVKEQQEEGGWLFVFSGANIDAFAAGGKVGVVRGATAGFVGSEMGVQALYLATSSAVLRSRTSEPEQYRATSRGAESFFSSNEVSAMAAGDASLLGGASSGSVPAIPSVVVSGDALRASLPARSGQKRSAAPVKKK